MKKRALSLMLLFAISFGLVSGCKSNNKDNDQTVLVVDNKDIIATIDGVNYSADQIFDSMINLNSNVDYIYEKLQDLLIKTIIPVSDSTRSRILYAIESWKEEIKQSATISGKSYKDSLKEALEKENVSSEEELIEKRIFELQKQIIASDYADKVNNQNYESFAVNGMVYHISQILVKVSTNGNSDAFGVSISEETAKKLYNVANSLLKGESFYNVAIQYSDDSNTKNKGGDMGLVTLNDATSSSLPTELKYALASYSIYLENANISHPEYLNTVYSNGIETIPQEYVDMLNELSKDESTHINTNVSGTSSTYTSSRTYARNIIFNNLFNSRTFRFIQSGQSENVKEMTNIKMPVYDSSKFSSTQSTQNILTNDSGYPILVVRSDSGIHFISINMSGFASANDLKKYYSKEEDLTDNFLSYIEKASDESDKSDRLSKLETLVNDYSMMKITGNSNLTGNDSISNYNMFNYYLENGYNGRSFEIVNEKIKNLVLQYINSIIENEKLKINNQFTSEYLNHSNKVWYTDYDLVTKEIPLLDCLRKDSEGQYRCVYTYKDGFKSHNSGGDE